MSISFSNKIVAAVATGLLSAACGGNAAAPKDAGDAADEGAAPTGATEASCKGEGGCRHAGECKTAAGCKGENGCEHAGECKANAPE